MNIPVFLGRFLVRCHDHPITFMSTTMLLCIAVMVYKALPPPPINYETLSSITTPPGNTHILFEYDESRQVIRVFESGELATYPAALCSPGPLQRDE